MSNMDVFPGVWLFFHTEIKIILSTGERKKGDNMMIGEKIKVLRKIENLSQELFAEKLNVSRSTELQLEFGEVISVSDICKIEQC